MKDASKAKIIAMDYGQSMWRKFGKHRLLGPNHPKDTFQGLLRPLTPHEKGC